jgi:hypothetical protein
MKNLAIALLVTLPLVVGCTEPRPYEVGLTKPTVVATKPAPPAPETPRQKLEKTSPSLRAVIAISPDVRIHLYPGFAVDYRWQVIDDGKLCSGGGAGPTVEAAAKDCLFNRKQRISEEPTQDF